jgi:hypothetical protein
MQTYAATQALHTITTALEAAGQWLDRREAELVKFFEALATKFQAPVFDIVALELPVEPVKQSKVVKQPKAVKPKKAAKPRASKLYTVTFSFKKGIKEPVAYEVESTTKADALKQALARLDGVKPVKKLTTVVAA